MNSIQPLNLDIPTPQLKLLVGELLDNIIKVIDRDGNDQYTGRRILTMIQGFNNRVGFERMKLLDPPTVKAITASQAGSIMRNSQKENNMDSIWTHIYNTASKGENHMYLSTLKDQQYQRLKDLGYQIDVITNHHVIVKYKISWS